MRRTVDSVTKLDTPVVLLLVAFGCRGELSG